MACCVTAISIWKWDSCRGWFEGRTDSLHVAWIGGHGQHPGNSGQNPELPDSMPAAGLQSFGTDGSGNGAGSAAGTDYALIK